jgi:hypothetical protein
MEAIQQSLTQVLGRINNLTAEVLGVAGEVRTMQHHMEDFGENLDGVKRRFSELDKTDKLAAATACPRVEVPPASHAASTAVLANKGAPILDKPPPLFDKPSHGGQMFHTAPSSPHQDIEQFKVRPSKHDFPRFSGDAPMLWIDLCLTYFDMYKIPKHQWVGTATLYLQGHAALWFQAHALVRCTICLWSPR